MGQRNQKEVQIILKETKIKTTTETLLDAARGNSKREVMINTYIKEKNDLK